MSIVWWGCKRWWRRPVWLVLGMPPYAPDLCELGIGPISFVWVRR